MTYTHDELVDSLALARSTPYTEVNLGSKWLSGGSVGRADVINIRPSYTRFCVDIYEVKASRSDYLSDIRSEKWTRYLPFCHRLYFAAPKGVIKPSEIPDGTGLYLMSDKGWYTSKGATSRDVDIPTEALYAFLFYRKTVSARRKRRERIAQKDTRRNELLKGLGEDVSKALLWYNAFMDALWEYNYRGVTSQTSDQAEVYLSMLHEHQKLAEYYAKKLESIADISIKMPKNTAERIQQFRSLHSQLHEHYMELGFIETRNSL